MSWLKNPDGCHFTKQLGRNLTSVVSYEERDEAGRVYGDPGWAGNCSGRLIKDLLNFYQRTHFKGLSDLIVADIMSGSGTVGAVCEDMGLSHDLYDLNPRPKRGTGGWNAKRDDMGRSPHVLIAHPPYWDMYKYSENVWPDRRPNPDDLSMIPDYWEFMKAWNEVQLRQFADLQDGGLMFVLVGDIKRKGVLYSMQRDMAWLGIPKQVIIKTQHNTQSDQTRYKSQNFVPIVHEYLVVMEKQPGFKVTIRKTVPVDFDITRWANATWLTLVRYAMQKLGKKATLASIYKALEDSPKTRNNPDNWMAAVRLALQRGRDKGMFVHHGEGVWGVKVAA